jgi:hypothetical protein
VRLPAAAALAVATCGSAAPGCVTIDPGPDYVIPPEDFNANYFYCFVEPQVILGGATPGHVQCGDNGTHGCHYSDKVPAMQLIAHAPVPCANGVPSDPTLVGEGSPASSNLAAVSIEMDRDWMNAPIYIWPTQIVSAHPIQVYMPNDTDVTQYLATWATE